MSPQLISDEILDKIRHHFDIVDVIGQYVPLKKSGRNYLGLCPFHSEKTPSFSVSPDKQIYHCFGCGAGGDVIRFTMDMEGLEFREAVVHLANDANVELPIHTKDHVLNEPQDEEKIKLFNMYDLTAKLFRYLLLETDHGKDALDYLLKRGFTRDIIETFNIGFAPASWDTLRDFLVKRGFSLDIMEKAGLIIKNDDNNYYDRFRNRVIFPISDNQGRTIAFGGRVLDTSLPKYLNSPETKLFNKSKTLYNLHLARKNIRHLRQAVLFEGYVDTIAAYRAGVENGVATLGTSLTEDQAKLLKRYSDEVVIIYDSDQAGRQATYRAIDILQVEDLQVKVVQLPQGLDPDDFVKKYGEEAFKKEVSSSSVTATAFKIDFIRKNYNLQDESQKMKFITEAIEVISDLPHAIEREHYLKNLASEFQLSLDSLKNDLKQIYYQKRKKKGKTRDNLENKWNNIINNGNHVVRNNKTLHPAYYNAEKYLIALMLRDKDIAQRVQQEIGNGFHIEDFAVLSAYIYSYYGNGYDEDISRFLTTIEDKKYVKLATELAIKEINENPSDRELSDYILQIKKYNLELEIKQKKEELIMADRRKDYQQSAEIGQEIIKLRNQLKLMDK